MSSSLTTAPTPDEYRRAADALAAADRVLVTSHENPDGDALGSLLAATLGLRKLGKDAVPYLGGTLALPREYGFLDFSSLVRTPPGDLADRLVLALDCANARRVGEADRVVAGGRLVVNVDHHHDNTCFGDIDLVVPDASSTGEIVHDLLRLLDVTLDAEIASALYVAVVTDTGRFQYSNTTPRALRLAAELVEAGADAHRIYQDVYENVAFEKLKLLARALEHAVTYEGGRLIVSVLARDDFRAVGADEAAAEGIVDHLRAVEGAELVALIREPPLENGGPPRKVSLRTNHPGLDVSRIARGFGGGGHRQAAGFHSDLRVEELVEGIHAGFLAQAQP